MQLKSKPTEVIRIAALLLEYFFMFTIIMIFCLPAMNNDSFGFFRITHEAYKPGMLTDPLIYLGLAGFSLLFCKDCINGQSIAKRLTKLQVVDNNTGAVATPMQCFTRNITLLILPIEVIVALVRPDRRIGDKIAGTKLVVYDRETNNNPERSVKRYILPFVLAYLIFIAIAFGLSNTSFNTVNTRFVASSRNVSKSKALEELLTGKFSDYYTVSVQYYDSIENKRFDYVSVICSFKEVLAIKPEFTNEELQKLTVEQVYSLFPRDQIHGRIQYVYRSGNSMTSWNEVIGTRYMGDDE